ncbi:hypothetical protein V8E54_010942 [Elaphomyces granulatus]
MAQSIKTALGLRKNQNSLAGVLETWEDCARVIDARYKKGLSQWNTKELSTIKEPTESNECDCKEFPCEHMLEAFLYGDAVEPDWDKYSSLFLDQKFDVYEGKRTEMAMDAGADSQGD